MRAVLAAVILGGVFGSASATVEPSDDEVMMVEIEVEVSGAPETVVAHLSFEQESFTLPLLDRGEGVFGLRTELERKNYVVVFEVVDEEGASSEPTSLQEMGADLSLSDDAATTTTEPSDEGLSGESRRLLWLAVALGAASLSLLAFWVLGGREDEEDQRATAAEEEE